MSKSANPYLIPALGGAGMAIGLALAVANMGYGESEIALLEDRVAQVEARATAAAAASQAEGTRAAELEAKIAEVQEAAMANMATASLTQPVAETDGTFGLGRAAHAEEIAAWDVDILPDGRGLPEGQGDVWTGEEVFVEKCGSCHGDFAEGAGNWPVLAGGFDTLADEDPVKTVGSYWPYLSTVWDYVHRSMPFGEAGTLTDDETYAIVAYILYSNDVVDEDFVLSHETFMDVPMHNTDGFVVDDRPALEYAAWRSEPCMENCKDDVQVTMRSVFWVDTPPEGGSESVMNPNRDVDLPSFTADGPSFIPAAAEAPAQPEAAPEPEVVVEAAAGAEAEAEDGAADTGDAELIAAGEKVFKKCRSCHQVGATAKNKSGPQLNGIFGRTIGGVEGFKYSKVFKAAAEEGRVWDEGAMAEFLAKPKSYMKGTKMSFSGLKKSADIEALIAYLKSAGG